VGAAVPLRVRQGRRADDPVQPLLGGRAELRVGLFGFAFAVNSSVHSYLVLAYAGSEKAAEDVGFYYAANALGRFFGTLLSGLLYQWGGLLFSLSGSAALLIMCWLVTLALPVTHARPTARSAS
jgi:predicted MFS family arabinose efflux permease